MPRKRNAKKKASRAKAKARGTGRKSAGSKPTAQVNRKKDLTCPIVGIGGAAGGFEATMELFKALPPKKGVGFVVVQHFDPTHARRLSNLLSKATQMPVLGISAREKPRPDTVYVLPPNKGLIYKKGALNLIQLGGRPTLAIDHFLESLAEEQGSRAIGVVLSGSGSDGTAGLRAIKAAGGITFAQDEESAKYPAMPRSAITAGFVDAAFSPKQIPDELQRIAEHPYIREAPHQAAKPEAEPADLDDLSRIFLTLKKHTGVDFTAYKQSTLQRRIQRRMALHRIERLGQYANFLRGNAQETQELFNDLLINVTRFFRD